MNIHTRAYRERLEGAGVEPAIARANAEAIEDLVLDAYVTREHLDARLKQTEAATLLGEERLNARGDKTDAKIEQVDNRLNSKIDQVEQRLNAKIDQVEQHLLAKVELGDKGQDIKFDHLRERIEQVAKESDARDQLRFQRLEMHIIKWMVGSLGTGMAFSFTAARYFS